MKRIGTRAKILSLVVAFFFLCTAVFGYDYLTGAATWVVHPNNEDLYTNGELRSSGRVETRDGTRLYTLSAEGSSYAEDLVLRRSTLHAVGDLDGNINTGVVKNYKAELIGYSLLNGTLNPSGEGNTITLTLDADTCIAAYNALGNLRGTVGIYNYETGEILCMISKPSFNPLAIPEDLTTNPYYDGVYINRLIGGVYAPGSIFKLIVTQAAIENIPDLADRTFLCEGGTEIDGEWVQCAGNHGEVDFAGALAHSCNAAFAQLSLELGGSLLGRYAAQAGVGETFEVQGVRTARGSFDVSEADDVDLAWAGIGQYNDLVCPIQQLIYMGAIANGGQAVTPYYVKSITNALGIPCYFHLSSKEDRMMDGEVADRMTELMRNNTLVSYGDGRFPGMELCAKTGTAQVDGEESHSWFVGFLDNPDTPLAFVALVENGGAGSPAIDVASAALSQAVKTFE